MLSNVVHMNSTLTKDSTTLKRHEIRGLFRKHHGAAAGLARELGITESMMSRWLKGKSDSARIEEAAQIRARELLTEAA